MSLFETYVQWFEQGGGELVAEKSGVDAFLIRPTVVEVERKRRAYRTEMGNQEGLPSMSDVSAWEDLARRHSVAHLGEQFVLHPLEKSGRNPFVGHITV